MFTASSSSPELLRLEAIREVLRSPGPCITILLPPYHPGERAASPGALLKSNLQEGARQLSERALPKSATVNLLEPLQHLARDPALVSGSHWGRAIFRSPSVFEQFHLTHPVQASLSVGGSFAIRKLARELGRPGTFYILALYKTRVSLLRCAGLHAEPAKLPPGVPDTLLEALSLEPPDHDLENRSAAGSSTGAMHSVRFGTGSGRETEHAHLADFYKLVDRALPEIFPEPNIPLILAGVEEDTAMYRAISTYRGLARNSVLGSPDLLREQIEMLQQAYSILLIDGLERQASALIAAKERTSPSRFSTDPDTILRAAFEGRMGQLYVDEDAERIDVFEREKYRSWGREDLLNLAAVQTIIHHGKSCELPTKMMPHGSIAAGLMRF
jgi:hypothetical protein